MQERILNENFIKSGSTEITFVGWTNFDNENFADIDTFPNCIEFSPLVDALIAHRLFIKGIKFSGSYHQNGDYGAPLISVNGSKPYKFTCTFRYWGGIMEKAGYAKSYIDWAWDDASKAVHPDGVENKEILI